MPRRRDESSRRRKSSQTNKRGDDSRSSSRRPSHPSPQGKTKSGSSRADSENRKTQSSDNRKSGLSISRSPQVRRLLEGIGTPPPAPFAPDPFQLEALARIEHEDVIVTAPTGAGKTWIAREEIRRLLASGRRAWYTSPLKALTNSKYSEFAAEFGVEQVGILTGDRKENADAPLLVGTTEIYRNQLFDALRGGDDYQTRADLVILDEAHYLADEERGHVWEEAIILTPARVRLLLLSATIGNAGEFARWMMEVRGRPCAVVTREAETETSGSVSEAETRPSGNVSDCGKDTLPDGRVSADLVKSSRPVPLRAAFLFSEGEIAPLLDRAGNFNAEIMQTLERRAAYNQGHNRTHDARRFNHHTRRAPRMEEMPPARLLAALEAYDLLPAIVFMPTRRRCDEAAMEAATDATYRREHPRARRDARAALLEELTEEHPEIRKHRHREIITRAGVAAHHAGHLPAWKLVIEKLMSAGLLDAIFATTTVAAGVDFPARTVVLSNADARDRSGWRPLTATEFQQMSGRAGRRGKDNVGFVVAAPGAHQNPQLLAALLRAAPDPLESGFRATYTTLLNLLDAYGDFAHVREIIERSFAHRDMVGRITRLETEREKSAGRIRAKLDKADCPASVDAARGLERLASARHALLESVPQTRAGLQLFWLDEHVKPGRIVGIGRNSRRLVFVTERRGANFAGVREDGRRATFHLERIGRIYEQIFPLDESSHAAAFESVRSGQVALLEEPRLRDARASTDAAIALIADAIDRVTREGETKEGEASDAASRTDSAASACREALWSTIEQAEAMERAGRRIAALRDEAWAEFAARARVLDHFGYLDRAAERVTERGRWLADLRVERPLLVGEALARGLFARVDAPRMAALVAATIADAERDYGQLPLDDKLVTALARFERVAHEVASIEWKNNLDPAPEMNYSAAATVARWAAGARWDSLVRETQAEEGDLFRLLARTGEALLQLWRLRASHPEAAEAARVASEMLLREPVRSNETI